MAQRAMFLFLLLYGSGAYAEIVIMTTSHSRVSVDTDLPAIVGWNICYQPCAETENRAYSQELAATDQPVVLIPANATIEAWQFLQRGETHVDLLARRGRSAMPPLRLRIELQRTYEVRITLTGESTRDSLLIRLTPPAAFDREPGAGFSASREFVAPLALHNGDVLSGEQLTSSDSKDTLRGPLTSWTGFRNRFWTLMARVDDSQAAWSYNSSAELHLGYWESELVPDGSAVIYAGPIAPSALRDADPALMEIVFEGMWFWLRWLCLGLLYLLNALAALLGSWGVGIIALSLIVKLLMTPLIRIAERWQAGVNQIQSQLQPRIDIIKRESKGEEQANRILAAHKELGVTPFYTFRSTFGFLIQIPVFIAVFNVLNEAAGLNGTSFLWIDDLARPDHFLPLPFDVPFFGDHINLLPILMTVITLLGTWWHRDETLFDELQAKRRRSLYWMAALFFILFYTFPAGMVLYWTCNTLLQAIRDDVRRRRSRRAART